MERWTWQEVEGDAGRRAAWAAAAGVTPGVSVPGSSPAWGGAAQQCLHLPGREAWVWQDEDHWVALARGPVEGLGVMVQTLEMAWGFACPVVGPDPAGRGWTLLRRALSEIAPTADGLLLGGIPRGGALEMTLRGALPHHYGRRWAVVAGTDEVVADLSTGVDAWRSRRSAKFLTNLRAAGRRAQAAGLTVEMLGGECLSESDVEAGWTRLVAADARSWKAAAGESVFQDAAHRQFYRQLVGGAGRAGRLRLAFLRGAEAGDVGYLAGYQEGEHFRGLQLGYDPAWAPCAPAHLLQEALLPHLVEAGVRWYNLGMDIDYKARWADQRINLAQVVGLGAWR